MYPGRIIHAIIQPSLKYLSHNTVKHNITEPSNNVKLNFQEKATSKTAKCFILLLKLFYLLKWNSSIVYYPLCSITIREL